MNLFTFVFKQPEARVMLTVALVLLGMELTLRATSSRLSRDVQAIEGIPALAKELGETPGPRALFVGNSILLAGIDPARFRDAIAALGGRVAPFLVHPDASHIAHWDYLLHRYFIEPGHLPEEVILITGRLHLHDQGGKPAEFGAYYVSQADIPRYLAEDSGGFDAGAGFFLGRYTATARLRDRFSPRVFDRVLPYFQENWVMLHRAPGETPTAVTTHGTMVNTRHLRSIARSLRDHGVRLTIVKAPARDRFEFDPAILHALKEVGSDLIDLKGIPGIEPKNFPDPDHLDAEGKARFTDALAAHMAKHWIPAPVVR